MQNIRKPFVVSNLRLAVNQPKAQGDDLDADPGNDQQFQGYQGHYCTVPSRVDPTVIACSFIMAGLRVFDIADLAKTPEIAYYNKPAVPGSVVQPADAGRVVRDVRAGLRPGDGDIWYSDGNSGFYVVRLAGLAKRTKFARSTVLPGN